MTEAVIDDDTDDDDDDDDDDDQDRLEQCHERFNRECIYDDVDDLNGSWGRG